MKNKFKDPIDELLDLYVKLMPKEVYLVKNKDRYPLVEKAANDIASLALACDKDASVQIYPDELIGTTLCLQITTTLFVIDKIDAFCEALKLANTFEAVALTNGKVSVGLTFQDAWMPAPPVTK